jgi:hypothetical protein
MAAAAPGTFWSSVDCAGDAALDRSVRPRALSPARVRAELIAPLLRRRPLLDARTAELLQALALLWHDQLEAAHQLVQAREGDAEADLLHALLHRREGDYGNANYWFAAVGEHPLYAELGPSARALGVGDGSAALAPGTVVEAVRAACAGERAAAPLFALQRLEFATLAALLEGG